ncbi:HutD family protein [Arthrobacter sp. SO3]|uniref:HutD family protein n=1 Tax=Arthrobacter sp. SO3 TaxID=1897057 RepID=UPI001CFFFC9D|nr:HutD family protein [Arthrobacter sp. SO3]MCB5290602.1 hypothetical protein [Arthrobacter sp. SO3]
MPEIDQVVFSQPCFLLKFQEGLLLGGGPGLKISCDAVPASAVMSDGLASPEPEAFPGEADVSVRLATGPTSAINLITQRASCTGNVAVERIDGPLIPHSNAAALALLDGAALTDDGEILQPLDFLMCGPETKGILFKKALVATIFVFPR